jgi:Tol biopolymer transport system component
MDGQLVAFGSFSSNLVAGDTNDVDDVFVHDRSTGITDRVSVDSLGAEGNRSSFMSSISADGEFVAFNSDATNLVTGDTNHKYDVFVHDRSTGITERISVDSSGNEANDNSAWGDFSADDRVVSFASAASNLVSADTNGAYDVFVHDRQTGVTERVSVDSSGQQAMGSSAEPSISADGQLVAFESDASNLVPGDTGYYQDVFVHDRSTGLTERVSVARSGAQGNDHSYFPAMSADGRMVVFCSWATNLVGGDTNATLDVFVHGPYLTLEADPESAPAGATLTFTTWTGAVSGLCLLVVNDVNGTPTFVPAAIGSFDAHGLWTLAGTVPSGLSGNVITFETFGFIATGKVDVSNSFAVTFP